MRHCWCGHMLFFNRMALAGLIAVGAIVPAQAAETGRIQLAGVKTLSVSPSSHEHKFGKLTAYDSQEIAVGDTLPLEYMMVIDIQRYHFPRPRDGWVYFEVGENILRVDLNSREVLEQMDMLAN